ncbi:MAG TPA: hypothetical protein DEO56_05625 [Nitrosomonas nitrosa]|nr:hypothetical protein [Nitrosomonas nitrosa]
MSWKEQLIDKVFFSGLGNVLAKALPEHWQRRARERLNDFNPYSVIADNHDLMRAARLAWVKAALEVFDNVQKNVQPKPNDYEADKLRKILHFEKKARKDLLSIRSAALDRRPDPA